MSVTREEHLSDKGWSEPLDESPFETSDGWEGGAVVNTGGGIYCRIWRNEDERIEVLYGLDHKVVEADRLVEDEDYGLVNNGDVIEHKKAESVSDEAKASVAQELIENLSKE